MIDARRLGLTSLFALLTAAPVCAVAATSDVPAVPRMELPQARIDGIDTSAWPKVRVLATILDRRGAPAEVKAISRLEVLDGKLRSRPPYIAFVNGAPLEGRKDGKLRPASKAGIGHATVLVVAGHQHEALRRGTLGQRLKESVGIVLKKFGKTDRGQLLWTADRISAWYDLKGRTTELTDIEAEYANCVAARQEARSGLPVSKSGKEKPPPPGTDVCGLRPDLKDVEATLQRTAYAGFFPRPFALGTPFYDHTRYCKPPRESLAGYDQISPENAKVRKAQRDEAELRGEPLPFQTSALDEALRLLIRDGQVSEEKSILFLSDGKDGYLYDFDLCRQTPPPVCAERTGRARETCIRDELSRRAIAAQGDFREKAVHWIGSARAAGIRIFAVGLANLGERWELDRLRLLAERSGGTYREVHSEPEIAGAVGRMASEVFDQVVIEFTHQEPEEAGTSLSLQLKIELDPTIVGGETNLLARAREAAVPEPKTLRQRVTDAVIDATAAAQDLLGYRTYLIVGIIALVVVGLLTLLISFLVLRAIGRGIGRLFRRAKA